MSSYNDGNKSYINYYEVPLPTPIYGIILHFTSSPYVGNTLTLVPEVSNINGFFNNCEPFIYPYSGDTSSFSAVFQYKKDDGAWITFETYTKGQKKPAFLGDYALNKKFTFTPTTSGSYIFRIELTVSYSSLHTQIFNKKVSTQSAKIEIKNKPFVDFDYKIDPEKEIYQSGEVAKIKLNLVNDYPKTSIIKTEFIANNQSTEQDFDDEFEYSSLTKGLKKITVNVTGKFGNDPEIVTSKIITLNYDNTTYKYKKIYITVPPEQKMLIKKENGSSYSDQEFVEELYNSILEAQRTNDLFFAPRTWPEAGKIKEVKRETKNGIPCVSVVIEKRILNSSGMENFNKSDLPVNNGDIPESGTVNPRGVIFQTLNKTSEKAIFLSSLNNHIFYDSSSGKSIQKSGLINHPIVLFAQNKNKNNFNAFGKLATTTNLSFEKYPFQPFLTLFREDLNSNSVGEYYNCLSFTNSTALKSPYRIESTFSIVPFDINRLKFRDYQDKQTDSGEFSNWGVSEIISDDTQINELKDFSSFSYKGPRGFDDDSVSNPSGDPVLKYKETGVLFSRKTEPEYLEGSYDMSTLEYNDFSGAPYYYGNMESGSKARRAAFFETLNNISTNTNENNNQSLLDMSLFGKINSSIVNMSFNYNLNSSFLSKINIDLITPVNIENRFITYVVNNSIYVWDSYNNIDSGPYNLESISKTSKIMNINGVRDVKIPFYHGEENPISINTTTNTISRIPVSPKYFSNCDILVNLYSDKTKKFWELSTSKIGTNNNSTYEESRQSVLNSKIEFKQENNKLVDNLINISFYENSVFLSTESSFLFCNIGKNSYTYKVNIQDGSIQEDIFGKYSSESSSSVIYNQREFINFDLNNENEKQTINILGEQNGIPFTSSDSIVLSDNVKPYLVSGTTKLFTDSEEFKKDLEFCFSTSYWLPDRINVCGTQLKTIEDYKALFEATESNFSDLKIFNSSVHNKINFKFNPSKFWKNNQEYISGTNYVGLELESFPTGNTNDGSRKNIEQIDVNQMYYNFSNPITLVNHNDLDISISMTPSGVLETKTKILNAKVGTLPSGVNNYYFSKINSYVEISNSDFTPIEKPEISGFEVSNENRYSGCTIILEDGRIFKILRSKENSIQISIPFSLKNEEFNIKTFIESIINKKFAIAAFVPNKVEFYDNKLNFGYELTLSVTDLNIDNNYIEYKTTTYIPSSDSVYVKHIEDFKSDFIGNNHYTKNKLIDINDSMISGSTQVNIGFYRNFDSERNLFINDIINDRFNRLYPRYNLINYTSKIYTKISSSTYIDIEAPVKFVIVDKKSTNNSKIIYDSYNESEVNSILPLIIKNISNKKGCKEFLLEIRTNRPENNSIENSLSSFLNNDLSEIEIAFEAYDVNGLKVSYGSQLLLQN